MYAKEDESVRLRRTRSAKEEEGQNESEEGSGNWEKEKLRKNEVEETHNSGSQKDPKERSKVGKNGGVFEKGFSISLCNAQQDIPAKKQPEYLVLIHLLQLFLLFECQNICISF